MKSEKIRFLGYFLLVCGVLLIFITSIFNTMENNSFDSKSSSSQRIYVLDVLSTFGVVSVAAGIFLLLKMKKKNAMIINYPGPKIWGKYIKDSS